MQFELSAKETLVHIVDKFVAAAQRGRRRIPSLCGASVEADGGVRFLVDWNWKTCPNTDDRKSLCRVCLEKCDFAWYRKQREHNIPPVITADCERILRTIREDISRTDDLEVLAKLGGELRATSNRFYNETVREILHSQQRLRCALCEERQLKLRNLELDHIKPRAKGGTSAISNLQLACRACNRAKGDTDNDEYLRRTGRLAAA